MKNQEIPVYTKFNHFYASNLGKKLVLRAGLEPTTLCLEGRCSIQLSYRSIRSVFSRIPHMRPNNPKQTIPVGKPIIPR